MHAGALTLVLDLGSLLMESDTETHARLPAEAAALYQCLRLTSRDISAYLVDGAFSFAALERAGAAQTGPVCARMALPTPYSALPMSDVSLLLRMTVQVPRAPVFMRCLGLPAGDLQHCLVVSNPGSKG